MTAALDTDVVVVGAGPVGLMLAGELRLGGAEVVVIDQLDASTTESRASTVHARTMELFDQRDLVGQLGGPGRDLMGHFGGIQLPLDGISGSHLGQWKVPQTELERVLGAAARRRGAWLRRGCQLVNLAAGEHDVRAQVTGPAGPATLRSRYLVGCDGERSTVRRLIGSGFPGVDARHELLRADVAGIDIRNRRFERLAAGLAIASRRADGVTRVMVHEFGTPARFGSAAPTFADVVAAWARVTGEDIGHGTPLWVNAFGDTRRQASRYRVGRVLLAGDAAHAQMPVGGQALNLGLQDAVNLGWKLAAAVRGWAGPDLLDTYHDERHAVGAEVLANIAAQSVILLGGPEVDPLRSVVAALLEIDKVRTLLAGGITGLGIRYPDVSGSGDRLVGRRLPPTEVLTDAGAVSTAELLRHGGGLLLDLEPAVGSRASVAQPWADRVRTVRACPPARSMLAEFGAVLVRPDGYVAWTDHSGTDAHAALTRWFGGPQQFGKEIEEQGEFDEQAS
jgi:oxygenase